MNVLSPELLDLEARLKALIDTFPSMAVAFSGGIDSSYLADVAHEVLDQDAHIVLADSPSIPRSEVEEAAVLARERGWRFEIIETRELENPAYRENDGTRCYHCRTELFTRMEAYARREAIAVLAYGEITDDLQDPTRVGARAAREYRVAAPLAEAGLNKEAIRILAQHRNLPNWDKPSFACLASRVPKGSKVDREKLGQIEQAEEVLKGLGFRQYRVRHHDKVCRIEVEPQDLPRLLEGPVRDAVVKGCRAAGYDHVTVDLAGYRTGSTA